MLITGAYYAFKVNLLCSIMLQKLINNDGKYSKKLQIIKSAAEDGCIPEYCAELLHLLCSNFNLLCWHNYLMFLITYYAQNYASIIC